jgi:predicted metal-dependent hydrolase
LDKRLHTEQQWPPEYRLRKSRRAKYLQLKVSPEVGLEVIVPYRFGYYDLNSFLTLHREWIEKKLKTYQKKAHENKSLPTQIQLLMTGEVWHLCTIAAMGRTKLITRPDKTLVLMGDLTDIQHCQLLLKKWLRKMAQSLLVPMLEKLSIETGLPFQKVSIREQKSRWGSCSSRGDIALNSKLIFLPESLVRYVLIHELCHTRHFNHSKRFWALVAEFDPHYAWHKREIHYHSQHASPWGGFAFHSQD